MEILRRIRDGSVTVAFRRWKRPTVRTGGTLHTAVGLLSIDCVEVVDEASLTDGDALAAGVSGVDELRAMLVGRAGDLHRVELHWAGPDPRIALRESEPSEDETHAIEQRLEGWDAASVPGPWTRVVLGAIGREPGRRAGDLASSVGLEKDRFKGLVRKLKGLGLTESLSVGYRLSKRGAAIARRLGIDHGRSE